MNGQPVNGSRDAIVGGKLTCRRIDFIFEAGDVAPQDAARVIVLVRPGDQAEL